MSGADPSRATPTVSVVFSFFNEEPVLAELLRRVRAVLRGEMEKGTVKAYEMVFVNDSSTDRSREILTAEASAHGDVVLLNMSRNFGVSACTMAGLQHAAGDTVIYMDADLQDPPEIISQLLDVYRAQGDVEVVHTVRRSRAGETRIKLWVTKLGYQILRQFATIDLLVDAGDFKLLSRRAVDELIALPEKRPFTRGLVSWIGFKQATIHYHRAARFAGRTKFLVFSPAVLRNFMASALISFSDVPLQLASLIGAAVSLVAFIYALVLLAHRWIGVPTEGWSYVLLAVISFSGLQLLTTSVLGLYLAAVHLESKRRPSYIIESTAGVGLRASHTD